MSIFGTDGVRGRVNDYPMTPDIAMKIAAILGKKVLRHSAKLSLNRVVIAKDTRKSCYMLEAAMTAGFISAGADVILTGPVPTPAVSMLTKSLRAEYGVMISASHNPFEDNGIKIFDRNGIKITDAMQHEVEELLKKPIESFYTKASQVGKVKRLDDVIGRYIEFIKSSIPKGVNFHNIKIILDVANGAAYRIAPEIFRELGAEVTTLNNEPNGENINKNCGSTYPDVVAKKVKEIGADIGISLDGDADRLIICDEKGEILDGDSIIGLIAKSMQESGRLSVNKVVVTAMSNLGLEKYLESLGLEVVRVKVGDRNVISKMQELGCNLGGEQSGHIIMSEYSQTGDGILAAIQVISYLLLRNLRASQISKLYKKVPQILENLHLEKGAKINLDEPKHKNFLADIAKRLEGTGRVLVRKSGTENLLRIMIEGTNNKLNTSLMSDVKAHFKSG